jgi:hypothetical protein
MADDLNKFYLRIKVYNGAQDEVYNTVCPRSIIDKFTLYFVNNYPRDHYFKMYDLENNLRYDSRILKGDYAQSV